MWSNRLKGDRGKTAKINLDGIDFCIKKNADFPRKFNSHKFNGSALRYEVATNIQTGDIVWTSGPWLPGVYNDVAAFRKSGLKEKLLKAKEKAEADDGYRGELKTIRHPNVMQSLEDYRAKSISRKRHETINGRLKKFNCLTHMYRHDMGTHPYVFKAVVVLVQLSFENGEKPFHVKY